MKTAALEESVASLPPLKLEKPELPKIIARGSVERDDFAFSATVDHFSNGRVMLSCTFKGATVMLHFTAAEWEQLTRRQPQEGT